ncbi:MAG: carbon-nitrogen hydrolase family protein [Aureliella sp.]
MAKLTIALANARIGTSPADSLAIAIEMIGEAASKGAQIVCFPESYVPGYRCSAPDFARDSSFLEAAWEAIDSAAAHAKIAVIMGTEREEGEQLLISTRVTAPSGACLGFQDKVQLDPSEESIYSPGQERRTFEIDGLTFGIVICHEGWRYPETVRAAARQGAQIVFHPHTEIIEDPAFVAPGYGDPNNSFHEKAVLCRAAENHCFFATVNNALPGATTTAAVANPDGTLLAYHPHGQHGLLIAEIDPSDASCFLAKRLRT